MTVNAMRYISDLRVGRVNPSRFNFDIHVQDKKYDLAEFVSDNAVDATDVPKLITGVEPDSAQYRATEAALAHYLELEKQQAASPELSAPLPGGGEGAERRRRLSGGGCALLAAPSGGRYVCHSELQRKRRKCCACSSHHFRSGPFRRGEGLPGTPWDRGRRQADAADDREPECADDARVMQLQSSLERWRWLPDQYLNAPLMVNLPEFVLRGYTTPEHKLDFTMKLVVARSWASIRRRCSRT